MIRLAALLANGSPSPEAFAAYATQVGPDEAGAAHALLTGTRPKRLATAEGLLTWVAEATGTPAFLVAACLVVTPDKAEVAALLMPLADGAPPTLTEVLTHLTDREAYLTLTRNLPRQARLILNRLAAGTFRSKLTTPVTTPHLPGTCLAILTLIDPAGPEATFALPQGNALVPLCKLRLTLPETAEILSWARANTTDRFGPLRQVSPNLLFELGFDGLTANPRRKSGVELVQPRLIAWRRLATPDQASHLPLTQPPALEE